MKIRDEPHPQSGHARRAGLGETNVGFMLWLVAINLVVFSELLPGDTPQMRWLDATQIRNQALLFAAYFMLAGIPVFSFRLRAGILTALAMVPLGIALEFIHVHIPGRSYQEANIVAETCGVFGGIAFALAARWVDQALERTSRTAARQ
jgi:4-amino-4-deoxy-L-arabinose transferase-like glycosyltransferase